MTFHAPAVDVLEMFILASTPPKAHPQSSHCPWSRSSLPSVCTRTLPKKASSCVSHMHCWVR